MTHPISIERAARPLGVDNRITLRNYYRIADSLIRQANIYRNERNIIDLYVMLLRFASLITDTIPNHRDYKNSLQYERDYNRKKLLESINELERLKPDVQLLLVQINRRSSASVQANKLNQPQGLIGNDGGSQLVGVQRADQHRGMSLCVPPPKEETLLRHSFFGANGLQRPQPASFTTQPNIQYPSTLDLTSTDFSSLLHPTEVKPVDLKIDEASSAVHKATPLEEVLSLQDGLVLRDEPCQPIISEVPVMDIGAELSPPPLRADVQELAAQSSAFSNALSGQSNDLQDLLLNNARAPVEVHISIKLMDSFLKFAKSNTDKNLETCGVLSGPLKGRRFYVTTLIIPKQNSTSNSCEMTNEEDVATYQIEKELFALGWIHTHPTQTCFMSSIDVHTQYSYQLMLPEAIAIVMAPRDSRKSHGIFRLTDPGGMMVIKGCQERGFHAHPSPPDGNALYREGTDVYMDPSLMCEVADLR